MNQSNKTDSNDIEQLFDSFRLHCGLIPELGDNYAHPWEVFSCYFDKINSSQKAAAIWIEIQKAGQKLDASVISNFLDIEDNERIFPWLFKGIKQSSEVVQAINDYGIVTSKIQSYNKTIKTLETLIESKPTDTLPYPKKIKLEKTTLLNIDRKNKILEEASIEQVLDSLKIDYELLLKRYKDAKLLADTYADIGRQRANAIGFGKCLGNYFKDTIDQPLYGTTASITNIFLDISPFQNPVVADNVKTWMRKNN